MEDWEVNEGVGGHKEVGKQGGNGLKVSDQNATDGNAEDLHTKNSLEVYSNTGIGWYWVIDVNDLMAKREGSMIGVRQN